MPTSKRTANFRLAPEAIEVLEAVSEFNGVYVAAGIEILVRAGLRDDLGIPDRSFQRWHDSLGVTVPFARKVSDTAHEGLEELARLNQLSQADTLEWLAFAYARANLPEALPIHLRPKVNESC